MGGACDRIRSGRRRITRGAAASGAPRDVVGAGRGARRSGCGDRGARPLGRSAQRADRSVRRNAANACRNGIACSRAEAPREYLQRVLVVASGAEPDASTLTGLFEEARFSPHPIPERLRALALSALGSLRARLEVASSG